MCSKYFVILCVICCCLVPRATCLDSVNMLDFLRSSFAHIDRKLTISRNDLFNKINTTSVAMEKNFKKIKEAVDKINDRTDALANNQKTNLETLRNVYERLNTLEKTLKDKSLIKSDAIDSIKIHINEDLKEFADDVAVHITNNVTKQITDQLDKTFEEQIMNLTMREHNSFAALKEQIINSALEEQKQFTALKEMINSTTREQELKLFLKEQIVRKEQKTAESTGNICQTATVAGKKNTTISRDENNPTNQEPNLVLRTDQKLNNSEISEPGTKPFTNICEVYVPNTVVVRDEETDEPPFAEDELDTYMINRTGCRFHALRVEEARQLIDEPYGGRVRVQFSLRTRGYAVLQVELEKHSKYIYKIGNDDNSRQLLPPYAAIRYVALDLLAARRYVSLYLTLEHGNLTMGLECAGAEAAARGAWPLFSHTLRPAPRARGARVTVGLRFDSYCGGKLLSHCPLV